MFPGFMGRAAVPGRPIRLPHGVASAVATARAAMLDLQVLQVCQIADQAKGKEHRPRQQDELNRIQHAYYANGLIHDCN